MNIHYKDVENEVSNGMSGGRRQSMADLAAESIEIVLNGERKQVPGDLTVDALLKHLQIDETRIAVEIDRNIVRKRDWSGTTVRNGAQVEVVQFVGGG